MKVSLFISTKSTEIYICIGAGLCMLGMFHFRMLSRVWLTTTHKASLPETRSSGTHLAVVAMPDRGGIAASTAVSIRETDKSLTAGHSAVG